MSDVHQFALRAAAMPRIGFQAERSGRPRHHPLPRLPRELAERLLRRLDTHSRTHLPFDLGPTGEWRQWAVQVVALTALSLVALAWMQQSWTWSVAVLAILVICRGAALLRHQDARRRAASLREHLNEEGSVADLEAELLGYIHLAPEDPAARYLLALSRMERSRPLEALLQLATLRDRYPAAGEVVLLAAIACAQLERPRQAGRLLGALSMEPQHPWWSDVLRFAHACGSAGPNWGGDFAESGTPS